MSTNPTPTPPSTRDDTLFAAPLPERASLPIIPLAIAGAVVLLLVIAFILMGRHQPATSAHTVLPPDSYASSLPLSGVNMIESTSISGGKSTFIDGHIRNIGSRTVTGATVQVLFSNDEALSPQIETQPLTLIRTRQPYVDTELIGADPLAPGDDREFRLIFESIGANWNQQLPAIHIVHVITR